MFWKNCIMMLCVQVLATAALLVSNRMLAERQAEFYLKTVREQIDHNCERFSAELYKTYAIPEAIEGTRYYDYIRGETSGSLPEKYVTVLPLLQRALSSQMFLYGENEECLLYFRGADCIVTRRKSFLKAEECFEEYLQFSGVSGEELAELLRGRASVRILPMQEVAMGGRTVSCMTLLLKPIDSRIAVMTLWSEESIRNMLGFDTLPEGSAFWLTRNDGEALCSCDVESEGGKQSFYEITAELEELGITAGFLIPKRRLEEAGAEAGKAGIRLIGISILLGIVLNILLSEVFTMPMRRLLQKHGNRPGEKRIISEVEYLSLLIAEIEEKTGKLQALFENAGGEGTQRRLSWLWHERLYQSLLTGDRENTGHLLKMISEEPWEGTAGLESFYNVLFVLRSAAEELNVELKSLTSARYREEKSYEENILLLTKIAEEFHDYLDACREEDGKREAVEVLSFIRDNCMDDRICAQYVAKQFGISDKNVHALVGRETGLSFGEYLLQLRMQRAGMLLCTTTIEVKKVGEMCGYFSEATFFRVFKKYYNKTPGQYRKDGS